MITGVIIAKFGGTSVSTAKRIETICEIIQKEKNKQPIIVVSALAGVTNLLLSLPIVTGREKDRAFREIKKLHKILIEDFFKEQKHREDVLSYIDERLSDLEMLVKKSKGDKESLDKLAAFGEIMSSYIVSCALRTVGIKARQVIATDIIITNNNFGSAEFLLGPTKRNVQEKLLPLSKDGIISVVTGFIGATRQGKTTTLGRGGSDYTASILGFCINATEIQIWTDVDGIFTADPRFVKNAKLIAAISFKEASELATFGARVLHPRTIKPAIKAGIPVRVLNSFNPGSMGTLIVENPKLSKPIRAICAKRNITLVNIYSTEMLLQKGFLARIFTIFANYDISIDLVSVSEVSVSVTLDNDEHLAKATSELAKFATVTVKKHFGIVSIIGEGVADSTKTSKEIFALLDSKGILVHMVSLGATDINISLVLDNDHIPEVVEVLHGTIVMKE